MFKMALHHSASLVVALLLCGTFILVNADTAPSDGRSIVEGKVGSHDFSYGRTVYSDPGGHDGMATDDDNDDDNDDDDDDDHDYDKDEDEFFDDDEPRDDELGLNLKNSFSSVQRSRHLKKSYSSSGEKNVEKSKENMWDENKIEDMKKNDELVDDELGLSPHESDTSAQHPRGWKKDAILRVNKHKLKYQQQNLHGEENDENNEDGSADDIEANSSGLGSGREAVHTRKENLRKDKQMGDEGSTEDWSESSSKNDDDENELEDAGSTPVGSDSILEGKNENTKATLKRADKPGTLVPNLEGSGSDDEDENSGEGSGFTDSVQTRVEPKLHLIVEHNTPVGPRPQNRTGESKQGKEELTKVQLKSLKTKYNKQKTSSEKEVNSAPGANEIISHIKNLDNKSTQHKVTPPTENKAEKKQLRDKDVKHKEQETIINKAGSKLNSSPKKGVAKNTKVSLHRPEKENHSQHPGNHVTHTLKSHHTVSHERLLKTATSSKPRTCHSDKILSGHSLKGGTRAGQFEILGETSSMHDCLQRCCSKHDCDVALLIDGRCYGVGCYNKELCVAVPVPHPHFVLSQLAYVSKGYKRGDIEFHREFFCKYGNLTLRNNELWSGELCGGVVRCKDGVTTVTKCPSIPPKPEHCAKPRLIVRHQPGKCCKMKWRCKAKHCVFNNRRIRHGYKLSDPLCTGVVSCYNGHLKMEYCPKIPEKPKNCARPVLRTINIPGKCCKKRWVCADKSCMYDGIKLLHGEKLTDASCAVVMECRNGFLHNKQCPTPPPVPHACINPFLQVKRIPGECCDMKWTCAIS